MPLTREVAAFQAEHPFAFGLTTAFVREFRILLSNGGIHLLVQNAVGFVDAYLAEYLLQFLLVAGQPVAQVVDGDALEERRLGVKRCVAKSEVAALERFLLIMVVVVLTGLPFHLMQIQRGHFDVQRVHIIKKLFPLGLCCSQCRAPLGGRFLDEHRPRIGLFYVKNARLQVQAHRCSRSVMRIPACGVWFGQQVSDECFRPSAFHQVGVCKIRVFVHACIPFLSER